MAAQSVDLEESDLSHPEFDERRVQWAAELNPVGDVAEFALDRVVAATFRIERCERALNEVTTDVQHRAALAWDQDRAVEAATIAARLGKDPVLASRQLQATLAGVTLLVEFWIGLVGMLEGRDWSETEASKALDLLGVNSDLREGRTLIDAPKGTDSATFRRALAIEEINRLETLREKAMIPLDELGCSQAMVGDIAILSKPAKLILRYEREAWKRYWESMKEIKAQAPQPVVVAPTYRSTQESSPHRSERSPNLCGRSPPIGSERWTCSTTTTTMPGSTRWSGRSIACARWQGPTWRSPRESGRPAAEPFFL